MAAAGRNRSAKKQIIESVCPLQSSDNKRELLTIANCAPQGLSLILKMTQNPGLVEYFLQTLCEQPQSPDISDLMQVAIYAPEHIPIIIKKAVTHSQRDQLKAAFKRIAPNFSEEIKECQAHFEMRPPHFNAEARKNKLQTNPLIPFFRLTFLNPDLLTLSNIIKIICNRQLQKAARAAVRYLPETPSMFGYGGRYWGVKCMSEFIKECFSEKDLSAEQLKKAANKSTTEVGIFRGRSSLKKKGSRMNALVKEGCCSPPSTFLPLVSP